MRLPRVLIGCTALAGLVALLTVPHSARAGEQADQPATSVSPASAGQQLGSGQAMSPRVVRLQHAGSANGHLIASVSASSVLAKA